MTKSINLAEVRNVASEVLVGYGDDYRNVIMSLTGAEMTGCVNVVAVKNGERTDIHPSLMDRDDDDCYPPLTLENLEKSGVHVEPGCFVGTILIEAGLVTIKEIIEGPKGSGTCSAGSSMSGLVTLHQIHPTKAAKAWMTAAQLRQDRGSTWGEAFRYADSIVLGDMMNGRLGFADL